MAEYTIEKVSQEAPREWGEGANKTYYIKVKLSGRDKPVSIGKKQPDALKVGDKVHGTITETQYETDKFQADKMQNGYSGGHQPKDEAAIKAQFAIKAAVQALGVRTEVNLGTYVAEVEEMAKELFAMVDRVKSSEPKKDWVPAETRDKFEKKDEPLPPEPEITDSEYDAPIDMDSIPF